MASIGAHQRASSILCNHHCHCRRQQISSSVDHNEGVPYLLASHPLTYLPEHTVCKYYSTLSTSSYICEADMLAGDQNNTTLLGPIWGNVAKCRADISRLVADMLPDTTFRPQNWRQRNPTCTTKHEHRDVPGGPSLNVISKQSHVFDSQDWDCGLQVLLNSQANQVNVLLGKPLQVLMVLMHWSMWSAHVDAGLKWMTLM